MSSEHHVGLAAANPSLLVTPVETLLPWSPGHVVTTLRGKQLLRKAAPTPAFWAAYRAQKAALTAAGVTVSKSPMGWEVCWWRPVAPSPVIIPAPVGALDTAGLLDYQAAPAQFLAEALQKLGSAIDTSDPGTGKTFTASAVARHLLGGSDKVAVVVCPKAVRPSWGRCAKHMGIDGKVVALGYEQAKTGKTGYGDWTQETLKNNHKVDAWRWDTSKIGLLIFDEVHRCKGRSTGNAQLLIGAKDLGIPTLALSATAADDPLGMRALGYALGLHAGGNGKSRDFYNWCGRHECEEGFFGGWEFATKRVKQNGKWVTVPDTARQQLAMAKIHQAIKSRMARVSISDLGDKFPECLTIAEPLDMGPEIQRAYKAMQAELEELATRTSTGTEEECQLTVLLRARQQIELLRVPALVELAQDELEQGRSVVIFCSFNATMDALCERLKTSCVVRGGQSDNAREANIQAFQADRERIIICNIAAGGVGISLHDLHGRFPRTALICPTWRIDELRQALGRIWRAEAKSKAIQRFCYAAGGVEEAMAEAVANKGSNLNTLNGDDLTAGIEFLRAYIR